MNIACIVPVRKGSQRVPHKNTRKFGDTTLLEHKLKTLSVIKGIDIILNTDCEYAMAIGTQYGVIIHQREPFYASSECSNAEFFRHIAENVPDKYQTVMYCPVTSPFLSKQTIEQVIQFYNALTPEFDSVITSNTIKQPLWLDGQPLNYDVGQVPKSQELPNIQAINFGIAILPRTLQIQCSNVYGHKPYLYNINEYESIDIDTLFDFEIAQLLYKKIRK